MQPDIFMTNFSNNEEMIKIYLCLGKALVYVTRFEGLMRAIYFLFQIKKDFPSILENDEIIKNVFEKNKLLGKQIEIVFKKKIDDEKLYEIINSARESRNFIVHEISKGLDSMESLSFLSYEEIQKHVIEHIEKIIEADKILSVLLSLLTKEAIPRMDYIENNYKEEIIKWIRNEY